LRARRFALSLILVVAGCGGSTLRRTEPEPPAPVRQPTTATSRGVAHGPVRAKLQAPTHAPKVGARWPYRVVVRDATRRPLAGRITVEIVDPLGRPHAVQYDDTKRNITRMPFRGKFSDFVQFPADGRGYRLTVRVRVSTAKGDATLTYAVTPR
jgi:hypothetical protein